LQTITNNIREVKQFVAHEDTITTVNWSHDGKFLITGSTDKTARIWNLSGKLIAELKGHDGGVTSANFSPDGKHILTRSYNKVVRIWDFSGKQVAILKHQEQVNSASFSPDGKRIITTSANPRVMSSDGKRIVNTSKEKSARIWDLSGNLLLQLPHQDVVNSASYSPDGKYILTASHDKTARVWDASGKLVRTLSGHSMYVQSAYWSPNGKYILTNSNDFFVWDVSGKKIAQLKLSDTDNWATTNAGFSADSQHILVSNPAKTYLWDLSGRLIREIQNGEVVNGNAEFSPDGQRFLTTNDNIKIWNSSGRLLNELTPKQGNASWSPDGKYIVSVGEDRIVRIWDLSDIMPGNSVNIKSKDFITQTSWSPNSKYLVTTTNKSVLLWDTNGKQLARFQGH
jgi:WD40 repeat protein